MTTEKPFIPNLPFIVGQRVRLREQVDLFDDGFVLKGATGTIVEITNTRLGGVRVLMDVRRECLDEWDNVLILSMDPDRADPSASLLLLLEQLEIIGHQATEAPPMRVISAEEIAKVSQRVEQLTRLRRIKKSWEFGSMMRHISVSMHQTKQDWLLETPPSSGPLSVALQAVVDAAIATIQVEIDSELAWFKNAGIVPPEPGK